MSDPATRHAHGTEQILDLLPEIPTSLRDRIEQYLTDRDRSIEDGIDSTLRKTVSKAAPGDATAIVASGAAWATVTNAVSVIIEKHSDESRFEVDGTINGEITTGPGQVRVGARYTRDDDPSFAPVIASISFASGDGYTTAVGFNNTAGFVLPAGRYLVELVAQVSPGASFTQNGAASIRVVESLY